MFSNIMNQKRLLFLFGAAIFLVIIVILLLVSFATSPQQPASSLPTPTPTMTSTKTSREQKVSVIQKGIINNGVPKGIEKSPDFEYKTILPDGDIKYTFESPLVRRKNEIIAKNDSVIFERILTPEKSITLGYAKISDYTKIFGQPPEIIRGSYFYGPFISTLIYADKGIALIGNRRTDEAYEIHVFEPMSVKSYRELYGEDINENAEDPL